ncbi:MAG: TatD family hydrolase [Candidatus Bathyarchaeia archaeon]
MKSPIFTDAHIHLSDQEYAEVVEKIINDSKNSNVVALVSNSMDFDTSIKSLELAERYSGRVYAALGIHPWNVKTLTEDDIQRTEEFILKNRDNKAIVAIGEVGLDYKYEKIWDKQLRVFQKMLHLSEKLDLPVIIHSRGTTSKIVEMLPSYSIKKVLLHWFSNPISKLPKIIDLGYYISEGPPVVYSNGIREVVKKASLTHLLTETDGPVLYFKHPFEGKITTPAFIPMVVKSIAEIKGIKFEEAAEQIAKNFEDFFRVKINSK